MQIDEQSFGGIARLYGRIGLERLAGAHVAWSGVDTDPVGEQVELARRQHAELLPDVDAAAVAMLSVFS